MVQSAPNTATSSPLATFLASDAPSAVKHEIQGILTELAGCCPDRLDAAAVAALPPALLARCEAIPPGLDLFRILRGESPEAGCHRPSHVAASLRGMRSRKGRAPVAADYPANHAVPVLACVYYGGLDAWGQGAAGRVQRRKGHWQVGAHQEAALRDVAARFPALPLVHATLERAGYHAVAKALSAAELTTLATGLGLERKLGKLPNGWWTAERTLDTYAALCREARHTLSNHSLIELGGAGCSIRVQARRHFSDFSAFQAAAMQRHPDLSPPERIVAADGTQLESRAELVAYEAIRSTFPEVAVATHVVLPGGGRRSCDLVLGGGRAWVEVLGMARAEMQAARSGYQRTYAQRWAVKQALYLEHGLPLVLVEPADIVDPGRLATRVREIAALLGREALPLPAANGRCIRVHGTWTFEFLCQAVRMVAAAVGGWPTGAQLAEQGYGTAVAHLKQPELATRVAAAIGVPLRRRKGEWSRERVTDAHVGWVREHGCYPTEGDLAGAGQATLARARQRLFAGCQQELRDEVGRRCGRVLPSRRLANGSYATQESCAALLRPLCDRLGRFPLGSEMRAELPATLYAAVSGRWGMAAMAKYMGVAYAGPCASDRVSALAAFRRALPREADPATGGQRLVVTTTAIRRCTGAGGIGQLYRFFGGIAGLRAALAATPDEGEGEGTGRIGAAEDTDRTEEGAG